MFQKNKKAAPHPIPLLKEEREQKKAAFTLAETLIVLVILGVIAAIVVPALIRNHVENANRTKLKKCMKVYDMFLSKFVIENGLKTNDAIIDLAKEDCSGSAPYFKSVKNLKDENGNETLCRFCTADKVCWNIEDPTKPIISFDENNLDTATPPNSFGFLGHFGRNGELRIDDLAYEKEQENNQDNITLLADAYNFMNNVKTTTPTEELTPIAQCKKEGKTTCEVNGVTYTVKTW